MVVARFSRAYVSPAGGLNPKHLCRASAVAQACEPQAAAAVGRDMPGHSKIRAKRTILCAGGASVACRALLGVDQVPGLGAVPNQTGKTRKRSQRNSKDGAQPRPTHTCTPGARV